jgi:hypothetical protein
MAKRFGTGVSEAIFSAGCFPYTATSLHTEGVTNASIAGIVIAGFGRRPRLYRVGVAVAHRGAADGRQRAGAIAFLPDRDRTTRAINDGVVNLFSLGSASTGCTAVFRSMSPSRSHRTQFCDGGHSFFFFVGQAAGPVVYGLGLSSGIGIIPVLLTGAVILTVTGWTCALQLHRPASAV